MNGSEAISKCSPYSLTRLPATYPSSISLSQFLDCGWLLLGVSRNPGEGCDINDLGGVSSTTATLAEGTSETDAVPTVLSCALDGESADLECSHREEPDDVDSAHNLICFDQISVIRGVDYGLHVGSALIQGEFGMTLCESAVCRFSSARLPKRWPAFVLVILTFAVLPSVRPQQRDASDGKTPLTGSQVVEKMVEMNLRRAQALHSYRGTRSYHVEYRGLLGAKSADMMVDVIYRAPGTKEFTILSSTGSSLMIDKVLKKLLQAETEAGSAEGQQRTALNNENYTFTLIGLENTATRQMYVLAVEPKTRSKFLYRGRVWVDAADFAVVHLAAEPAKNPSFWTKNNQIEQLYQKLGDFWLPQRNHSVSSIRIGGRAELTIQYQSFQITESGPVRAQPGRQVARSAGAPSATPLRSETKETFVSATPQ